MNIDNICKKFELLNNTIYQSNEIIRPFIDAYFIYGEKSKLKLFENYVLDYERIINSVLNDTWERLKNWYPKENIYTKNNTLNLKNKYVKKELKECWAETFIGFVYINKGFKPFYLRLREYDNKYIISGFHIQTEKFGCERNFRKIDENKGIYFDKELDYSQNEFSLRKNIENFAINTLNKLN